MAQHFRSILLNQAQRLWKPRKQTGYFTDWPWPGLVGRERSPMLYRGMANMFEKWGIKNLHTIIDIGLDYGQSTMFLATICQRYVGMDTDIVTIDLSDVNSRMQIKEGAEKEYVHLPTKSLVDADIPPYDNVDVIKIDAGQMAPFILEALAEVIERSKPIVFIVAGDNASEQEWNYMIRHQGYKEVEPVNTSDGVLIAYTYE